MAFERDYFHGGTRHGTYGDYDERQYRRAGQTTAAALMRHTPATSSLDVGCAKGYLVEALAARGVSAWGVDISHFAIGEAPDAVKAFVRAGDSAARHLHQSGARRGWDPFRLLAGSPTTTPSPSR